jgi:hypothetical protein
MVRHGNQANQARKRIVRKSGSLGVKLVDRSVCCNLQAERAKTRRNYIIDRTDDLYCGGAETERP